MNGSGDGETQLSPTGRIGLGLLLVVGGSIIVMAAFGLGPLSSARVNGPRWLGAAAGGVFLLAGMSVAAGPKWRQHPVSHGLGFLLLLLLAAMGNWIAFGAGARGCTVAAPGLVPAEGSHIAGFGCRAAFGVGALAMNGIVLWLLARGMRGALGPGPASGFIDRLGEGLLLVGLAPILIPMVLILALKVLSTILSDRVRNGEWPRNESFIARMKKRPPGLG